MADKTAEQVLRDLIEAIDCTGGLVQAEDADPGVLAPAADPTWIDLAPVYLDACTVLGAEPQIDCDDSEEVPA